MTIQNLYESLVAMNKEEDFLNDWNKNFTAVFSLPLLLSLKKVVLFSID